MKENQRKLGRYLCKKWYSLAIFTMVLMGASFCMFDTSASALTTVPTKTNFQGRLTNSAGNIMADGLYNMKFRLFTVDSGGTAVWTETRETTNRVQVTNGLFSVKLGDVAPLPASLFASGSLYFEVELPTPGTATCSTAACASFTEGPMTPRNQLATSAYAYNSETLDGLDSASFARTDANNLLTGSNTINVASANAFDVQNGSGVSLFKVNTSASVVTIATTAGNTLSLGNSTGALTVTGSSASTFILNGVTVDTTEFNRLDGKDAALVDTNDAVTTAITGTGVLSAGSIASGFGTILTGSTITGTTLNGTTGINTGAGAGTQRIDVSGNLVNIGTISTSGAVNGASISGSSIFGSGVGLTIEPGGPGNNTLTLNGNATGGVRIGHNGTSDVLFGGGYGSTGCTVQNTTGDLSCDGTLATTTSVTTPILTSTGALAINSGANGDITIDTNGTGTLQVSDAATFAGTLTVTGATTANGTLTANSTLNANANVNFTFSGTERFSISSDLGGSLNALQVIGTPSTTAGTARGILVQQADSLNTNGIDSGVLVNNADTDLAITNAIHIANSGGGGYTNLINAPSFVVNGSGAITSGVWNGTALTDAYVSDTLTASSFLGSGSTTNAVDLGSAEVAGILSVANGGTGATSLNDLIALGSHTTGNYVGGNTAGTGIAVTGSASEGWSPTISLDYSATLASNPALSVNQSTFAATGLIFEGSTANTYELLLTAADPDADGGGDVTLTLPAVTGTIISTGNINEIAGLIDSQISDTLTASSLLGPGSTTSAVDLATAEIAGILSGANGGTGQSSYTIGDLLYASGATTLSKLSAVAAGSCLTSQGVSTAPTWADCEDDTLAAVTGRGGTTSSNLVFNGTVSATSDVTLSLSGTENLVINSDLSAGVNLLQITGTPSNTAGTTRGILIQQANVAGTEGLDTGLYINNSNTNLVFGTAIHINNSGGAGYTNLIDTPTFDISGTGVTTFGNSTDSTAAFSINNAAAASLFVADTTNSRIRIGSATADATGVVLVLDTKNDSGDPTGVDGAMYYNSSMRSFRCYQNGVWRSCIGGLAYANTAVSNTVANTTAQTDFNTAHTIPAGSCQPGRVYRVTARGIFNSYNAGLGNAGNVTIRVKIGGTIVGDSAATAMGNNRSNRLWTVNFDITCLTYGASGTVEGQGLMQLFTTANANTPAEMSNTATVGGINLTTTQTLSVSAQFSVANAGNNITLRQLVVEELGP